MIKQIGDSVWFDVDFDAWTKYAESEVGPFDPDFHTIYYKVFGPSGNVVDTGEAERLGVGRYRMKWTAPSPAGTYIIEFRGDYDYDPHRLRVKVKTKF